MRSSLSEECASELSQRHFVTLFQLLRARADGHFQQRALPAAFYTWYRGWLWHQQRRILHTKAVRFHRGTLEKQVFALWRQKMSQHRENCLAERMAILQAEQQLLRRFWFVWHQQAAVCQLERQQQAMAIAHHHSGLLRRAFCICRGRSMVPGWPPVFLFSHRFTRIG